jgi:sugar/nucleoside kinase (ribokinase family)
MDFFIFGMVRGYGEGYGERHGDDMTIYQKIDGGKSLVAGVGSALVDILIHEDDRFVEKTGAAKGGMTYVEKSAIDETVAASRQKPVVVPGGSACNTAVGIARLGGRARFVGKCGDDAMGRLFRDDLSKQKVEPMLFGAALPTGRVLSIITPDAQRSMLTYLGASAETRPEEMKPACFDDAAIVHVEGYMLFNRELFAAIISSAKQAGALISLDLASFNVVEEAKDVLPGFVAQYVDILIANEDEASAYTGSKDEAAALEQLSRDVDIAVLKIGARGSRIAHGGRQIQVAPYGDGRAVDTTGAGDLWAAGFLFGLVNRWPLEDCGQLGSICGHAVCQVVGANIPDEQWQTIRKSTGEKWRIRK